MTTERIKTPHGDVSSIAVHASDATASFVFAHGAGASIEHAHMEAIAGSLSDAGISSLRFNFPYMERGGGRTDRPEVCIDVFEAAVSAAKQNGMPGPLIVGGHSFGGRMSTHYAASDAADADAIVCYSFPLHLAKKPAVKRAEHLPGITIPMLFLSGTRDGMAERSLMTDVTGSLPRASLHWLDTADHGFKILKRTRTAEETVYEESARVFAAFARGIER